MEPLYYIRVIEKADDLLATWLKDWDGGTTTCLEEALKLNRKDFKSISNVLCYSKAKVLLSYDENYVDGLPLHFLHAVKTKYLPVDGVGELPFMQTPPDTRKCNYPTYPIPGSTFFDKIVATRKNQPRWFLSTGQYGGGRVLITLYDNSGVYTGTITGYGGTLGPVVRLETDRIGTICIPYQAISTICEASIRDIGQWDPIQWPPMHWKPIVSDSLDWGSYSKEMVEGGSVSRWRPVGPKILSCKSCGHPKLECSHYLMCDDCWGRVFDRSFVAGPRQRRA